mmetsp:Transcript_126709/g.354739  ORF Transcript_126709/g.354739 Transcript_126709/m.354739 type:complete len:323 (-) Transcript_126709:867-1835(-)
MSAPDPSPAPLPTAPLLEDAAEAPGTALTPSLTVEMLDIVRGFFAAGCAAGAGALSFLPSFLYPSGMPPRSGTEPMMTDFTDELTFEPRPATRAEMTFARTPRVQARALHSDNGGASLMLRRQPDHILDNVSATFRWPSGVCANSPADIDCTDTSRRRSKICRRVVYSSRSICAISRTFISWSKDQLPPFNAGASEASGEPMATTPLAAAASAIFNKLSGRATPSCNSEIPAALLRSLTSPRAKDKLAALSTVVAMPSKPSSPSTGFSAQPPISSVGPANAGKSKPRPAARRAASTSEPTSASKARRQKLFTVGAFKPCGRT